MLGGLSFGLEPVDAQPARAQITPGSGVTEVALDGRLTVHAGAGSEVTKGRPRLAIELRQALTSLADELAFFDLPDLRLAAADLPLPGLPAKSLSLVGGIFGQAEELEANLLLRAASDGLRQGDLSLRDVALHLPLHATFLKGALEAQIVDEGRIEVAGLSHGTGLRLTRPAQLTITEGTLLASPPSPEGTGGDRFAHDIRGRLAALALTYDGGDGEPLAVTLDPARLKLIGEREGQGRYRGRLQLSNGGADLPSLAAKLDRLNARLDFDAAFDRPKLALSSDVAYRKLPTVRLDAKARKRGQRISFEADLGAASGPLAEQGLRPRITGDHDLAPRSDRLRAGAAAPELRPRPAAAGGFFRSARGYPARDRRDRRPGRG